MARSVEVLDSSNSFENQRTYVHGKEGPLDREQKSQEGLLRPQTVSSTVLGFCPRGESPVRRSCIAAGADSTNVSYGPSLLAQRDPSVEHAATDLMAGERPKAYVQY